MNPFACSAFMSVFLAVVCGQQYCTEPVKNSCKSSVGASACITTECAGQTSSGDADFRKTMLDEHNRQRAQPYFGSYGANMLEMKWNAELEDNALRWLQHLCEGGTFEHDDPDCRKTSSCDSVGQNLFFSTKKYGNFSEAGLAAIDSWMSEKDLVKSISELNPYAGNLQIAHFTQCIWADTYLLGCAYLKEKSSVGNKAWVACNYARAGNVVSTNTFLASDSLGSNCTEGSKRGESGLCKACKIKVLNAAIGLEATQ